VEPVDGSIAELSKTYHCKRCGLEFTKDRLFFDGRTLWAMCPCRDKNLRTPEDEGYDPTDLDLIGLEHRPPTRSDRDE
jgi:hypothetical protein